MSRIYTKEILEAAVQKAVSFSETCRILQSPKGGNGYQRIKRLILEHKIDTSHFLGKAAHSGERHTGRAKKKHYTERLVNDPHRDRRLDSKRIRRALIESGRPYICEKCGLTPTWQNEHLTLQTDHINGDWRDCRQSNLQFLCPNCHSQTETFCQYHDRKQCVDCGKKISSKSTRCIRCTGIKSRGSNRKCQWPSKEELQLLVWKMPTIHIAKQFGVSDNAVAKWCKVYGIDKPPRGYWTKNGSVA